MALFTDLFDGHVENADFSGPPKMSERSSLTIRTGFPRVLVDNSLWNP